MGGRGEEWNFNLTKDYETKRKGERDTDRMKRDRWSHRKQAAGANNQSGERVKKCPEPILKKKIEKKNRKSADITGIRVLHKGYYFVLGS